MDHRLPNPFNPADVWTPDALRRCLVERVPGVVDVEVSRNIDGELASRPESRVVTVVVTVLRSRLGQPTSAAIDAAKRHALELVAVGCPPHVSATVTARLTDVAPDPPARPGPDRLGPPVPGLERQPPLHLRRPALTHVLAAWAGIVAAGVVNELGWLGW